MIIDINKDLIPYEFEIELDNIYNFTIDYNTTYDYFTVDLAIDDSVIITGEKLLYGRPLFGHLQHLNVPKVELIPIEILDKVERITFENLGNDVFIFLGDSDE